MEPALPGAGGVSGGAWELSCAEGAGEVGAMGGAAAGAAEEERVIGGAPSAAGRYRVCMEH